jgi:DNA-directed RNA polymerase subunit H (RpoH/RPB5)
MNTTMHVASPQKTSTSAAVSRKTVAAATSAQSATSVRGDASSVRSQNNIPTVVSQVYRGRHVLLEQLDTLGFDVDRYRNFTVTDIHSMLRFNCLDMMVSCASRDMRCYVKYQTDSSKVLKQSEMDAVVEDLFDSDMIHGKSMTNDNDNDNDDDKYDANSSNSVLRPHKDALVYVLYTEPSGALLSRLKTLYDTQMVFVVPINIQRLQFNIQNHNLVPLHYALSDEETQSELVRGLGVKDFSNLPEISRFDPVAMSILLRPGQVCRIERPSCTAVNSVYYRVCI